MTLGIQFGGLASGLDTGAIIDAILGVEALPMRAIEARKEAEQQKLTLIGTFEGLVNALRDKARDLQSANDFFAHKLSLGEEGIASFTLSGNVTPGAHTLEVQSLAAADRYAFAGLADPDTTTVGAGTVSFTYDGTAYNVAVTATDTLQDVAAAINAAAGAEVTASVINVGTETTPSWQLVMAGDETGADHAFTGLASTSAGLTGATRVSIASNAQVLVDGLSVQRSTNLFADVVPGLSFTVSRVTELGAPLTLTVEVDPEGMVANIKAFVDAYNEVAKFIDKQNAFSLEDGPGGQLFGDNALDSVRRTMRRALFEVDPSVAGGGDFSSLRTLGIELQADGTLKVDEDELEERLTTDIDAFSDFFRHEDTDAVNLPDLRGVFVRMDEMLDGLLDNSTVGGRTVEGLFNARRKAVGQQIKSFDNDIDRMQDRLDKLEEGLVAKFAALERLMSGLQSQQAFLNSTLGSLNTTR